MYPMALMCLSPLSGLNLATFPHVLESSGDPLAPNPILSLSMGTHDLRFLRNFFANLRVFCLASLISLMMTLSVECFCRFSLAMAQCGFVVVTINLFQKLKIFSVVFTSFDSCISECFNLNTRIVVNDRSSLQS